MKLVPAKVCMGVVSDNLQSKCIIAETLEAISIITVRGTQ